MGFLSSCGAEKIVLYHLMWSVAGLWFITDHTVHPPLEQRCSGHGLETQRVPAMDYVRSETVAKEGLRDAAALAGRRTGLDVHGLGDSRQP